MQDTAEVFNLYLKNEVFVCMCGRCTGESAVDLSPFIFSLEKRSLFTLLLIQSTYTLMLFRSSFFFSFYLQIKKFHRLRIHMFQESMEKFAEAQLRTARDVTAMLAKSLTKIKQFEIVTE